MKHPARTGAGIASGIVLRRLFLLRPARLPAQATVGQLRPCRWRRRPRIPRRRFVPGSGENRRRADGGGALPGQQDRHRRRPVPLPSQGWKGPSAGELDHLQGAPTPAGACRRCHRRRLADVMVRLFRRSRHSAPPRFAPWQAHERLRRLASPAARAPEPGCGGPESSAGAAADQSCIIRTRVETRIRARSADLARTHRTGFRFVAGERKPMHAEPRE